jgi:hypothetical protein
MVSVCADITKKKKGSVMSENEKKVERKIRKIIRMWEEKEMRKLEKQLRLPYGWHIEATVK